MASYTTPPRFAHGDTPTHTQMNILADDITHIFDRAGGKILNYARLISQGSPEYFFIHTHRWLYYNDNGSIVDPDGVGSSVTLSNPATHDFYDLDSISWMYYGKEYSVEEVDVCYETSNPV